MQFEDFLKRTAKLSNLSLPGQSAHFEMAPAERLEELRAIDTEKVNPRWAGVLALFYPRENGETMLVLILRKTYAGVHSNQVGFPGGRVEEEDGNLEETALRETEEEIGVARDTVTVVKKMTEIYIPPSNFWVLPFIAYTKSRPDFVKEEAEVEDIIEVSLEEFLDENSLTSRRITTSYANDIEVPAYKLEGHIVWGATAMMLSEIKWALIKAK